jgi:hypothetical protein
VKKLDADPASIQRIEGVWVPMRATMRDLRLDTFTKVHIEEIEPNPVLGRSAFELRRLEGH